MGSIDNKYSLMNVKMSDAGNYTCKVINKYGSIQHQFAVVVYGKYDKKNIEYLTWLLLV